MPIPSATEMNPSDGALAVFGRVTLGVVLALMAGGAVSMAVLLVPGAPADIVGGAGIGALVGLLLGVVVAPSTGFVAAAARHWVRASRRHAVLAAVGVWLVWVVVAALALAVGLRFPLDKWGNIWPFLPAVAVALVAAVLLARWVHRSEDPLTPEQLRELRPGGRPGTRGRRPALRRSPGGPSGSA